MYKYNKKETLITKIAIGFSLGLSCFWIGQVLKNADSLKSLLVHLFFILTMASGGLVYLISRLGFLERLKSFRRVSTNRLLSFAKKAPSVTFLIPSYKEEMKVICQSMLSCALQLYPNKRIVLLIDDPPHENPIIARSIPSEIESLFLEPKSWILEAEPTVDAIKKLHYKLAEWFFEQGRNYPIEDHVDRTFIKLTFRKRGSFHQQRSKVTFFDPNEEQQLLRSLFEFEISSFERKVYDNLSHAPNKAMNLNSYISLMGKSWKINAGHVVQGADFHIPNTDYVAMLDADSVLSCDYALRLLYQLTLPGMEKVAVIQTPYRAFPKAKHLLERVAGATTDIQYICHQGFTHFNATFWVGANAIVKKQALDEIAEEVEERGFTIKRYIQDKTVIEDTESSVDLKVKGWSLHNYPDRLSFSATPPDFGSLLIQRRRWANGGLLILPKLIKYLWSNKKVFSIEALLQVHYLGSLAMTLLAVGLLFLAPFSVKELGLLSLLAPWPYLLIYRRDLILNGYCKWDLYRVFALNCTLLPVNFAGVIKSLEQAITGKQIPFCRTPKIEGVTLVPRFYQVVEWSIIFAIAAICFVGSLYYPFIYMLPNYFLLLALGYGLPVFVTPLMKD